MTNPLKWITIAIGSLGSDLAAHRRWVRLLRIPSSNARHFLFPSSLAVILTGLGLAFLALGAFVWGWLAGAFSRLDAQARVILDDRDLRLARPWETPRQRLEREVEYGPECAAAPGEWGDGA